MSAPTKPSLYLIHGNESYQKKQALDQFRGLLKTAGVTERHTFTLDQKFQFSSLKNTGNQLSLFAQKKCLEIHIPNSNLNKQTAEDLINLIHQPTPNISWLVVLEKTTQKTFQTAWFKQLQQHAIRIRKAYPLSTFALKAWIQAQLKNHPFSLSAENIQQLVEKTQGNLLLTAQTLEKAALLNQTEPLSQAAFAQLLYDDPKFSLFELTDALLEGHFDRTFRILKTLISMGIDPILVIWSMAQQVRILLDLHFEKASTAVLTDDIYRKFKIWPKKQALYQKALCRISQHQLHQILKALSSLDRLSKGVQALPNPSALFEGLSQIILLFSNSTAKELAYATTE